MIVDNEAAFRKGLITVLQNITDFNLVAEASNGAEFLDILSKNKADIVFMDIRMPIMDGIEATRLAKLKYPELCIYGFSSFENKDYINKMLHAGATAYLSKLSDNYDALTSILNYHTAIQCNGNQISQKTK